MKNTLDRFAAWLNQCTILEMPLDQIVLLKLGWALIVLGTFSDLKFLIDLLIMHIPTL